MKRRGLPDPPPRPPVVQEVVEEVAPAPVVEPTAPAATPALAAPVVAKSPPSSVPFHDRRKAKRDPLSAPAMVRLDMFHGPPAKVELTDISVLGVRFRSIQPCSF